MDKVHWTRLRIRISRGRASPWLTRAVILKPQALAVCLWTNDWFCYLILIFLCLLELTEFLPCPNLIFEDKMPDGQKSLFRWLIKPV